MRCGVPAYPPVDVAVVVVEASAVRLTGFISRSSSEVAESPELPTGETATSSLTPSVLTVLTDSLMRTRRPDPLLEERLARPVSVLTLPTSFPFTDATAVFIDL